MNILWVQTIQMKGFFNTSSNIFHIYTVTTVCNISGQCIWLLPRFAHYLLWSWQMRWSCGHKVKQLGFLTTLRHTNVNLKAQKN